ncbi:MAG TPA: hypothetical protein VK871_07605 [Candidatus Limnocylindrales bacterium]|nr:hypothetical protein [Candidatus Limnocylindrales bacterium]
MRLRSRQVAFVLIGIAAALGVAVAYSVVTAPPAPTPSLGASIATASPATPGPGDATAASFRDFTVLPGEPTEPAGRALQSRLWSAGGRWFAAMVEPATRQTRIHELSADGGTFTDTGVVLDERPGAMVDTLWAGDRLYVASAVPGRSTSNGVRISRFGPDSSGRLVLDPNFPVHLTERGVGAASIARDSAGRLWSAFVQEGAVLVAHSMDDDAVWSAPESLPGSAAVGEADVAALVADGSGRLGIAWSDSLGQAIRFANRDDRDPPDRWFPAEVGFEGLALADEPISVATDGDGSIVVAVETAVADDPGAGTNDPSVVVLVRDSAGTWRTSLFARVGDHLGGPIVLVDPAAGDVYVLATSPRNGGSIQLKRSSMARLEFAAGKGLTVIADPTEPDIDFLTSTKEPISLADRFVVLGFDEGTGFYWHAVVGPPGGGPSPSPTSSPAGSAGETPSAAPSVAGATALFTDNFDPWPLGGPIGNGWELGPAGVAGSLTAVADPSGAGRHALLAPAGPEAVRACKAFGPIASGDVVAEVRVNLDTIAAADGVITSLRDRSGEAVSVRYGQGGTFAWYAGETKVRSTVPIRLDTWLRSTVTVHVASRTLDWRLTTDDGTLVVKASGVPFREATATQVSELCVQTSMGAGGGLRFDDVRVSH